MPVSIRARGTRGFKKTSHICIKFHARSVLVWFHDLRTSKVMCSVLVHRFKNELCYICVAF